MVRRSLWIGVVALALLGPAAVPGAAKAAEPSVEASIDELRHEIRMLQQTVNRLERRLSEVEKAPPGPCTEGVRSTPPPAGVSSAPAPAVREPAPPVSPPPSMAPRSGQAESGGGPSLRERWRRIERRMSADQVETLLGKPQEKFSVAGKSVWYYHYPDNRRGSVTFSPDKRVAGWQKPPFGGF